MFILKEKLDAYLKCYIDAHDTVKNVLADVVSVYEFTETKLNNAVCVERMKQVVLDQANESITQVKNQMKKSTTDFFNFLIDDKSHEERPQQLERKTLDVHRKVMNSDQELPKDFELDKGKEEEDDDEESDSDSVGGGEEKDDFIVPDNSDLSVYEGSEYDELFSGAKPKLQKTRKRPRRTSSRVNKGKIERLNMDGEDEDIGSDVDDLMLDEDDPEEGALSFSINDVEECRQFITTLKEGKAVQNPNLFFKCIHASVWFQKRYMEKIEMIRQNNGFQGKNDKALSLWNKMVETAFTQETTPSVSTSAVTRVSPKDRCCCFCDLKRNCPYSLIVEEKTYPIGTKCFELAKAVINFYEEIRYSLILYRKTEETISILDKAMGDIQIAHAGKQFKKRK